MSSEKAGIEGSADFPASGEGVQEKQPLNSTNMPPEDGTLSNDSSNQVKFINPTSQNGEAKIEIDGGKVAFAGMGKEELLRFANDPFWVRLRWFLFIVFWLAWIGMLVGAIAIIILAPKCEMAPPKEYWQEKGIYEVYIRSFKDSNGDGIGDLKGVESKVDYLSELGVGTVWLSPFYESPMIDFGYDISNYTKVDSIFGTIEDFDSLVAAFHKKDIKVVVDFVPNHSSEEHEWFEKSIGKDGDYTDYYVWKDPANFDSDGKPQPPNNWISVFGGSAWEYNANRKQFYLHQFTKSQPDLNVTNPNVISELKEVLRFWLEHGVDGFRMDAVAHLFEDTQLRDEPKSNKLGARSDEYDYLNHKYTFNQQPQVLNLLSQFRMVLDEYELKDTKHRVMMTEAYVPIKDLLQYYGESDSPIADIPFNFLLIEKLQKGFTASSLDQMIKMFLNQTKDNWPNWVLGNHDVSRTGTRFGSELIDGMNILLQTLPGTPVTYYGEEIGMVNTPISFDRTVDPAGLNAGEDDYENHSRDPERTPMQWDSTKNAGFTTNNKPWLPINNNYQQINVKLQQEEPNSHLNIYKKVAALRKEEAITSGDFETAVVNGTYAYARLKKGSTSYVVAINFDSSTQYVDLTVLKGVPESGNLVVSTHTYIPPNDTKSIPTNNVELAKYGAIVLEFAPIIEE